jgi:hypothetical protein
MLALCYSALSCGASIAELQTDGHLRIDAALSPVTGIVPGQRVTLMLEIATDSWFTGGTRIAIPEVPGLVILQTEQFASNASEIRDGQTWVIQRWTLDIFAQRTGEFSVGPIAARVQVSAGEDGNATGELFSPARHFTVAIPEPLSQGKQWVAAPTFAVRQSFDRALDALEVGDAFEQEILFEASDVMAMMLPTYAIEPQEGLASYPAPPVLNNTSNRGQTLATRSVRISYLVEQPGQYLLPAREYFWWNTQNSTLELVSLPETHIEVTGALAPAKAGGTASVISPRQLLAFALAVALFAAVLRLAWIYVPRLPLARIRVCLSAPARRWRALRKPALASRLNPGSSAGD